jgi:hypothetical protein
MLRPRRPVLPPIGRRDWQGEDAARAPPDPHAKNVDASEIVRFKMK